TTSFSMSTSTAIPAAVWGQVTRPAGPPWLLAYLRIAPADVRPASRARESSRDTARPTLVRTYREGRRMLLTITTTHRPASDLGFLLHKHPDRSQSFDLSFGKVHVFYPEVGPARCSACLLLDVDPLGLVRGKNASASFLP